MIERACDVLEALSGRGRPEALEVVARARSAGASADAVAAAVAALAGEAAPPRPLLGSPLLALGLSTLAAALAGAYGLRALSAVVDPASGRWLWPLWPLPLAVLGLVWALRGGGADAAWIAQAAAHEASLIERGLPADAARALVAFVVGGAAARSSARRARWAPIALAAGAALTVIAFWAAYAGLFTGPTWGGGLVP